MPKPFCYDIEKMRTASQEMRKGRDGYVVEVQDAHFLAATLLIVAERLEMVASSMETKNHA